MGLGGVTVGDVGLGRHGHWDNARGIGGGRKTKTWVVAAHTNKYLPERASTQSSPISPWAPKHKQNADKGVGEATPTGTGAHHHQGAHRKKRKGRKLKCSTRCGTRRTPAPFPALQRTSHKCHLTSTWRPPQGIHPKQRKPKETSHHRPRRDTTNRKRKTEHPRVSGTGSGLLGRAPLHPRWWKPQQMPPNNPHTIHTC